VGGRLLKCGENLLDTIPAATTRSADDLYSYCPTTHPTNQDTMVRGALDGSYPFIISEEKEKEEVRECCNLS
jgi:hypothetical protein